MSNDIEETQIQEPSNDNIRWLMSKKFALSCLSVLSCSVALGFGWIESGVYSTVMIATVGGYLAANVAQKGVVKDAKI